MRKNITPKAATAARDNRNTLDAAGLFVERSGKVEGAAVFSKKEISPIFDAVLDTDAALGISLSLFRSINDSLAGTELRNDQTGERLIDDVANLEAVIRMIRLRLDMAMSALSNIELKLSIQEREVR